MRIQFFVIFLVLCLSLLTPTQSTQCWETCFLSSNDIGIKKIWGNVIKTALEIKSRMTEYQLTKVAFLMDSSVSKRSWYHKYAGNVQSQADAIFKFQSQLSFALMMIINSQNSLIQFDEKSATSCSSFTCLDRCSALAYYPKQRPIDVGPTAHCLGTLGAACSLLNNMNSNSDCSAYDNTTMVIAVVNSDFFTTQSKDFKRSSERSQEGSCLDFDWGIDVEFRNYDPCIYNFKNRFVVGTHLAPKDSMNYFASKEGHNRGFFSADYYSFGALKNLTACMSDACCDSIPTTSNVEATCFKTQGPIGEIIRADPDHPFLQANGRTLGYAI